LKNQSFRRVKNRSMSRIVSSENRERFFLVIKAVFFFGCISIATVNFLSLMIIPKGTLFTAPILIRNPCWSFSINSAEISVLYYIWTNKS
jgi:hypothetical protein